MSYGPETVLSGKLSGNSNRKREHWWADNHYDSGGKDMKGLLIKDFRLLKGQVYFLLIVTGCVIVFMINGSEAFGVAYVCSMVALLSLTTVSYDEYENGSAFLFT